VVAYFSKIEFQVDLGSNSDVLSTDVWLKNCSSSKKEIIVSEKTSEMENECILRDDYGNMKEKQFEIILDDDRKDCSWVKNSNCLSDNSNTCSSYTDDWNLKRNVVESDKVLPRKKVAICQDGNELLMISQDIGRKNRLFRSRAMILLYDAIRKNCHSKMQLIQKIVAQIFDEIRQNTWGKF
jgi:hypothetical protein